MPRFPSRILIRVLLLSLALGGLVVGWFIGRDVRPAMPDPGPTRQEPGIATATLATGERARISAETAAELAAIETRERAADEGPWRVEQLADRCGRVFEQWWDRANASPDRLETLEALPLASITVGRRPHGVERTLGILEWPSVEADDARSGTEWVQEVRQFRAEGWHLAALEFRHVRFETNALGQPARSHLYTSLHLTNRHTPWRAQIAGELRVTWNAGSMGTEEPPRIEHVDATHLRVETRRGDPLFQRVLEETIDPPPRGQSIDPLLVEDLDHDGLPEIALAGRNLVYRRNSASGGFEGTPLCQPGPDVVYTAVFSDFDADGSQDYLCLTYEGLRLYRGSGALPFQGPGRLVWRSPSALDFPMVLATGDADRDGRLDVFLGQYKDPYEGGALPWPYFAATNGLPSFLLLNDGQGTFRDVTGPAGLHQTGHRRVYSASFVDLDGDGRLDLLTASDFAGLDVYHNTGGNRFENVTRRWFSQYHGFGMAHAISDLDADGRLDLLMIGMTSPTVDRLEHLGLWREGLPGDRTQRAAMAHGNRVLYGDPDGTWRERPVGESLARSGWSWGCGVADFDNDGFPDVFIANGLESKQSVRDYESEYWLHDLFVGGPENNAAAYLYFRTKFARTRGRDHSYGGYEKNRFFLHEQNGAYHEIGHLAGLALEQDSRNAVAADLDGDGGVDLVVTSFETWPAARQTLRIYRNTFPTRGPWIGFRHAPEGPEPSPVGLNVRLHLPNRRAARTVVTGDSYRSQHPATLHFGLGQHTGTSALRLELVWPDGARAELQKPAANRYHPIRRAPKTRIAPAPP